MGRHVCPTCSGSGRVESEDDDAGPVTCPDCKGAGYADDDDDDDDVLHT
jgi:DnaJ-class molecular chaperone